MNILDTFFFMFEADTTKVQKGAQAGNKAAKDLEDGINKADKAADRLGQNFVEMAKNGAKAIAAVFALGAIKTLVNDTAAHTAAVALQARAIDMSVTSLSAYQAAIVSMGGDAQQATATLGSLRDKFVEMSRFGAMVGPEAFMFRQLGLSAQDMADSIKDPTIALGKLAEKFQTLNQTQRLYIGQKLGLDQGTIALLGQGRKAFDELLAKQKELNAVTDEQADKAVKYKIAQAELSLTFDTVKREIVTQLLPAFTWVVQHLDTMIQWMREHKGFAIALFGGIGAAIATVLLPPLVAATATLWAFLAPALLLAAPFIAVGAAIGLVIDDIQKFDAGQKSLIGDVLQRWPQASDAVKGSIGGMKAAIESILAPFRSFGQLLKGDMPSALDALKSGFQPVINIFKDFFDLLGKLWERIKSAPAGIGEWLTRKLAGGAKADSTGVGATQPAPTPEQTVRAGNNPTGKDIAAKLVASGLWTPEQAAGIAGSFMQESGGDGFHTARNKKSGAYGLAQWLGSRVKDFKAWSGKELEGSSLDDQIAFFNYETTKGKERAAGDKIRAARTAEDAAVAHRKYYERPGAEEANDAKRIAYANMILAGQQQVRATNTPLASQSSQSIANSTANRSTTVNVNGPTTIATQATDPKAIAETFGQHLTRTFNDALDYLDNGVAA